MLKKLLLLVTVILGVHNISMAQIKSQVDECFELTSIAFRLAGAQEYSDNSVVNYTNDIDKYFAQYSNHKLIPFIQEIRNKYLIAYDAIPAATAQIEIKNGAVVIRRGVDVSKINEIDHRWNEQTLMSFVANLNDFYKETKFNKFFAQHHLLYKTAEERMDVLLKNVNSVWFESFYGEKLINPKVVVSLCNGPNNYGFVTPDESRSCGIVIGCGYDGKDPYLRPNALTLIIHEITHGFTNKRILPEIDKLNVASNVIYSHVKEALNKNAYGDPKTVPLEWFTRLCTIMYFKENDTQFQFDMKSCNEDMEAGFIWMNLSVDFMNYFLKNRTLYATINDFMPQLIGHYNSIANDFRIIQREYKYRHPYIVETFPANGSSITADEVDEIIIQFSKPMAQIYSSRALTDDDVLELNIDVMNIEWSDDYTLILPVTKNDLKAGSTYGIKLLSSGKAGFQSLLGFNIGDDYKYTLQIIDK